MASILLPSSSVSAVTVRQSGGVSRNSCFAVSRIVCGVGFSYCDQITVFFPQTSRVCMPPPFYVVAVLVIKYNNTPVVSTNFLRHAHQHHPYKLENVRMMSVGC